MAAHKRKRAPRAAPTVSTKECARWLRAAELAFRSVTQGSLKGEFTDNLVAEFLKSLKREFSK